MNQNIMKIEKVLLKCFATFENSPTFTVANMPSNAFVHSACKRRKDLAYDGQTSPESLIEKGSTSCTLEKIDNLVDTVILHWFKVGRL